MKKIFTLITVAVFCISTYAQEVLPQKWIKTASNYTWCTGNNQRDIAYYDGKIYIQDYGAAAGKFIRVINATNGAEESSINTGGTGFSMAVTDAGTILYTMGAYGMTDLINVNKWVSNAAVSISGGSTAITGTGRIDYINVYGDFEGTSGSYVIGATISGADNILIWEAENGLMKNPGNPLKLSGVRGTGGFATGADCFPINDNTFWVAGQNRLPIRVTFDKVNKTFGTEEFSGTVKPNVTSGSSGVAEFTLKGKTYVVCAENQYGSVGVYDITDGLSSAVLFRAQTTNIGSVPNGSYHVPIKLNATENSVDIFVYAPNNGIAVYEAVAVEDPVFSPTERTYEGTNLDVSIVCGTPGAEIRYTTDGTPPTSSSSLYSGAITLSEGETTIKVLATATGFFPNLTEATYTVTPATGLNEVKTNYNILRTTSGVEITLNRAATIELFSLSGQLIEKTTATGRYSRDLDNGMYIIRVNGEAVKFVK